MIWIPGLTVQNGGYVNPTNDPYPLKRQFRDPYHPWWDKQERRDFGEPVHEDNDILGLFSLEEYTHMSPGRGLLLWSGFIATILGLGYAVSQTYPDRPSAPKEYTGGLETELGGPHALRVSVQPSLSKNNANCDLSGMEGR
jgi:NADH dehydrogenase (ubiquinone) 1 beta subcomplex subunit 8